LATFVAPVESQAIAQSAARKQDRTFALQLVSGLTLFAFAVHGYHPYAEDGGLYLTGVKRLLDPALYPQQAAFVLEPTRYSLFAPAAAALARLSHLPLPWTLLALHLISIWTTLFAAWLLASRCWAARTARAGAVVLLACWLALPVAGTALLLMDPYVTARSFSTPAMALALLGALDLSDPDSGAETRRRGFLLCAGSTALAAVIHPLMAAYALAATLMLLCARMQRRSARIGAVAALAAIALAFAACLQFLARPETADVARVALTRTYWFLALWHWYEWIGLAAPLAILTFFARPASPTPNPAQRSIAQMAVAIGAIASIVALLFAHTGSPTHLVARLQPLRAFQIVYLIMVLMLGAKLGESFLRQRVWRWAATLLLLGGIMVTTARSAYPHSSHIELPGIATSNQWAQAFLWIRDHTPKNALFALDADYINAPGEDAQCFRAIAERSALPDYSKDGGEASIAPELTTAWKQGQAAQQRLSQKTDAERLAALRPLSVSWVVLEASAATTFDCPYANAAVKVCRLP
jgi:hypothetical protein